MIESVPKCAIETTVLLLNDKRKFLILKELHLGTKRFGELEKKIGCVSAKSLAKNLKEMEQDELILRTSYPEVPPRVDYSLTEIGQMLLPVLEAMKITGKAYQKWVEKTCPGIKEALKEAMPQEE